jgi:DNA-binding HxlR family transcriptional regulator
VKELLKELDKAFENKVRLCIMSALVVNDHLDFITLRELLDVTDGNLASHLKSLEKNQYVTFKKEFQNRKPKTKYYATDLGKQAFTKHINAIERILRNNMQR